MTLGIKPWSGQAESTGRRATFPSAPCDTTPVERRSGLYFVQLRAQQMRPVAGDAASDPGRTPSRVKRLSGWINLTGRLMLSGRSKAIIPVVFAPGRPHLPRGDRFLEGLCRFTNTVAKACGRAAPGHASSATRRSRTSPASPALKAHLRRRLPLRAAAGTPPTSRVTARSRPGFEPDGDSGAKKTHSCGVDPAHSRDASTFDWGGSFVEGRGMTPSSRM